MTIPLNQIPQEVWCVISVRAVAMETPRRLVVMWSSPSYQICRWWLSRVSFHPGTRVGSKVAGGMVMDVGSIQKWLRCKFCSEGGRIKLILMCVDTSLWMVLYSTVEKEIGCLSCPTSPITYPKWNWFQGREILSCGKDRKSFFVCVCVCVCSHCPSWLSMFTC